MPCHGCEVSISYAAALTVAQNSPCYPMARCLWLSVQTWETSWNGTLVTSIALGTGIRLNRMQALLVWLWRRAWSACTVYSLSMHRNIGHGFVVSLEILEGGICIFSLRCLQTKNRYETSASLEILIDERVWCLQLRGSQSLWVGWCISSIAAVFWTIVRCLAEWIWQRAMKNTSWWCLACQRVCAAVQFAGTQDSLVPIEVSQLTLSPSCLIIKFQRALHGGTASNDWPVTVLDIYVL